jgi:hypothetical protein
MEDVHSAELTDQQLVHDSVAVAVDALADHLHWLHAVVELHGFDVEGADRGTTALAPERAQDQIVVNAFYARRIERAVLEDD